MLQGHTCTLRAYRDDDVARLPGTIGRAEVVRWMSHRIPHPYTAADAEAWVRLAGSARPVDDFAIDVAGVFAGGAGIVPGSGEFERVAQIGYWIAPAFWGRDIAADATRALCTHAFRTRGVRRLTAWVFAPNVASARVLERSGFTREAVMRDHLTARDGRVYDAYSYARLASDPAP